MNTSPEIKRKIHPLLGRSYGARAFAYMFFGLLVFVLIPSDQTWIQYGILFLAFIYPTLFYHLGLRAKNTRFMGMLGYYIDVLVWGTVVVYTHYAIVLLLLAPMLCFVSSMLMMGFRRALPTAIIMLTILIVGQYFVPIEPFRNFSLGQALFAWVMTMAFMMYIAFLVNNTTRNFVAARHELQDRNEKIREQSKQLESISHVAQTVNSTLDLDEVMKTIMSSLNQVFSFTLMATLHLDKNREKLQLDRMVGELPPDMKKSLEGLDIPLSEEHSAFSRTILEDRPIYLPDVSKDLGAARGISMIIYERVPAKSMLTFPLRQDGEVEGVLAFANTREHFELDEENIEMIGRYVAYIVSAIRNANDYQAIQNARAAADAANAAKSQFLANMSHELRTPMNAVIGYTEMLQEEAEDRGLEDMVPDFEKIRNASHHLLQLINDVLDLSKIEAERIELSPERLSVDELLADIHANVQPLITKNKNQLTISRETELGEVFIDRLRLQQVLLNLLSNAAKFTRKGTIELTAERITESNVDWLTIQVRDSGIGMTPEQLDRVFEPFAQADVSTTREFGGTGLGLSISREICELMGGSLTASSELNAGSVFTVRIPVESTGIKASLNETSRSVAREVDTAGAEQSASILVIDDDANIRDIMTRILRRAGYSVITAGSSEEGIALAAKVNPAVIILDVLLPGLDGWSALAKLKSDPHLARIPVVMQSVLDESRKGILLGAADYLTKPVDRNRLIEVINTLKREGTNQRVLVVEDDAETCSLMVKWLENAGWEVTTAGDGREGLEAWQAAPSDLIILDLLMPNMDGFEFMEALREIPEAADTRVVVVTAKDLSAKELDRLNGTVERIFQKSDRPTEDILAEIARHLANQSRKPETRVRRGS